MARRSKPLYRIGFMSLMVAAAFGAIPRPAEACTCVTGSAVCEDYWKTSAVFLGRVETIARVPTKGATGLPSPRRVTFSVLERFRGVTTRTVDVRTGSGGGDCGYPFKEGIEYLVFASVNESTGELATGICSRTQPAAAADEDLAYARAVASGSAPAGRVFGEVLLGARALSSSQRAVQPQAMPNVRVSLERNGLTTEAVSDPQGKFAVDGLNPGTYAVSIDLAPEYYGDVFPKTIDLPDPRACAKVAAMAFFDGRVQGRVVDDRGHPIAGLTVELTVPAGLDPPAVAERLRALTNGDGLYELTRVPPGRFVIGLNTQRDREGSLPLPRVFLPGVERLNDARRVTVRGGEHVAVPDFVVPRNIAYVAIEGIVLGHDGVPAQRVRVYLKGPGPNDYILTEPAITDTNGRFVLAAVKGREYRAFAERPAGAERSSLIESSEQIPVTAGDDLSPLKLTLRRRY